MSRASWAPIDSTDAREARQRDLEEQQHQAGLDTEVEARRRAVAAALEAADAAHRARCVDGWLGEDPEGRPEPCLQCRPHLANAPCPTCATPVARCAELRASDRDACCDLCEHQVGLPAGGAAG